MGKIEARCQRRADLENDDHIDHEEWLELIDEAYGELFSIVAGTGLRYFERIASLVTVGTHVLDEPSSVMSTVGLWYVAPTGKKTRLTPIMPHELAAVSGQQGPHATKYELVDGFIYLFPTPPAGQTYELRYVPQPPDLSGYAPEQCVDVVLADGLSFIVWAVAVKAKAKTERDDRRAAFERDAAAAKVLEWATYRAITEAPRKTVTDVHSREDNT
jgi:hypothetical protein